MTPTTAAVVRELRRQAARFLGRYDGIPGSIVWRSAAWALEARADELERGGE